MTELVLPCSLKDLGLATLKTPQVIFEDGADDIVLAGMLVEIIESNVESSKAKAIAFMALKAAVYLSVTDAEIEMTLNFDKGDLIVSGGKGNRINISIISDSNTILELSNLKSTVFGLPNFFDELGQKLLKKILKGELKIKGIVPHIFSLLRVTKILSVA